MSTEAGFAEQQAFGAATHFQGQGPMMAPQDQALLMPGNAPMMTTQALYANQGGADGWLPGDEALELQKRMKPKEHSITSTSILVLGSLCFFLTFLALVTCEWRSNPIGVVGYKQHRGWGLFHVVGAKSQSHYEIMQFTCRAFGGLSIGGICNSPICAWYKLKCQVYIQVMWISYSVGVFMCLGLIVHAFCLYWTYKLTPRLIRWAATWWCVAVALELGGMIVWLIYTEDLFSSLGEKAIYPTPPVGASFALAGVSCFGLITCCILTMILMKIHPEDPDDDSDEEFSDSDDDIKGHAKEFMQWSKQNNDHERLADSLEHVGGQPPQAAGALAMAWPQDQGHGRGQDQGFGQDFGHGHGQDFAPMGASPDLAEQVHRKAMSSTKSADGVAKPPSSA